MRVIGYLRVSTQGQVKDGLGLSTQDRLVRAWAKRNGHRVVRVASDNGRSGALPETDRPGLLDALQAVRTGCAEAIVVTSLDRLARALTVQEAVLAKVWSFGGNVFTVDGGLVPRDDPDDPMRTALRQIVGVFAELDRRLVVKRLKNGRETKAAMGGRAVGGPPYGYRAERGDLAEQPDEQAVLAQMRDWQTEGASFAEIARRLNEHGTPARRGRWHPMTVSRALNR